jgi:hypothetical protein
MDNFSTRIANLAPAQKAALMMRLQANKKSTSGSEITRRPAQSNISPLSFAQQRLWFLDQLEPGVAYNLPFALRLLGPLDVKRLEQCVNEIVQRHEILRTTFDQVAEQPVQVISPRLMLTIPVIDLRHLSAAERKAETQRLISQAARQNFDLSRGPLLSCAVLHLADQEYVWTLTMHHIITDGWSIGLFVGELITFYNALSQGEPLESIPLPIQYADYVAWQREWLTGQVLEHELSYWKEHLAGAPHRLGLPTDYPRPPARSFNGGRRSLILSGLKTNALKELARAEGVTLFMTLLAVYEVFLHHLSNCEDIVVGCLIANRNHLETEDLIGFFVNQLVLRTKLSGDPTFRELLQRVRRVTLGGFDHQELPYQWLVDALRVERDLSCNPLFQVNFTFQNTPITALEIGDLKIEGIDSDDESLVLDVDLSLLVSEPTEGLLIVIRYNADLFSPATISRMLQQMEVIIGQVTTNVDVPLNILANSLRVAEQQDVDLKLKERKVHKMGRLEGIRQRRRGAADPMSRVEERL